MKTENYIQTNFLTLEEAKTLVEMIKKIKGLDYSVHIESVSNGFKIVFNEV